MEKDNLVKSFHEMWNAFPGMAGRLPVKDTTSKVCISGKDTEG